MAGFMDVQQDGSRQDMGKLNTATPIRQIDPNEVKPPQSESPNPVQSNLSKMDAFYIDQELKSVMLSVKSSANLIDIGNKILISKKLIDWINPKYPEYMKSSIKIYIEMIRHYEGVLRLVSDDYKRNEENLENWYDLAKRIIFCAETAAELKREVDQGKFRLDNDSENNTSTISSLASVIDGCGDLLDGCLESFSKNYDKSDIDYKFTPELIDDICEKLKKEFKRYTQKDLDGRLLVAILDLYFSKQQRGNKEGIKKKD